MGYIAKLTKGTTSIDLNAGRYKLAEDFVPPSTSITPYITEGGIKTGETALPRDWGFGVRVWGASSAEVKRGADDLANFLRGAGDEAQPLYFEWREDNNVSAEPVWGQFGATRRMEVVSGSVGYWESYATGTVMTRAVFVPVALTIKPWAQGARQRLATATGGICEDWIGTTDGRSRGLQIPEASTNKMTNPVFGHTTFGNGWTAGDDLTAAKNTNPEYTLFGLNSAKLTTNGVHRTYTQSIAAGNTNDHSLSFYAKLPNGGAVSALQVSAYYAGPGAATTYISVGDGWYRCYAIYEGIAAANATGVVVEDKCVVYITGVQFEERDYLTPLHYGDMLGCAWTGAVHATSSTRAAASVTLPLADLYSVGAGTFRVVWKADRSSVSYPAESFYLLHTTTGTIWLGYNGFGVTQWGSAGASSPVDTFPVGETLVFHLVWDQMVGSSLYINGILAGSSAYAIWTPGANLYIGSQNDATNQIGGTFLGFSIYHGYGMTAAEVLADYNNIAPLVADNQSVDPIPYIWTKDGDNIVDYEDSGAYRNIATIGGVAGDAPAKTEFKVTTVGMNDADVYMGNLDLEYRKHVDPEFLSYIPAAPPDVIDMTNVDITIATIAVDDDEFEILSGRRIGVMLRANDTINNVIIKTGVNPGGAYYYTDQLATTWLVGSESNDMTPEIFISPNEQLYREMSITRGLSVTTAGKRLAAGATHYHLHSAQIFPFPMLRFVNTAAAAHAVSILFVNGKAYELAALVMNYSYKVRGDINEFGLVPGRYNWLITYLGKEGVVTDAADTITYDAVYVTPRWLVA